MNLETQSITEQQTTDSVCESITIKTTSGGLKVSTDIRAGLDLEDLDGAVITLQVSLADTVSDIVSTD